MLADLGLWSHTDKHPGEGLALLLNDSKGSYVHLCHADQGPAMCQKLGPGMRTDSVEAQQGECLAVCFQDRRGLFQQL